MEKSPRRQASIDLLRGLIMALMALDHISGIIFKVHQSEYWDRPLPVYRDFLTFITRTVTHVCAPGFFLLLGMSLVLFSASRRQSGWTARRTARCLLLRGLLLILLQFLVINPLWQLAQAQRFSFRLGPLYFGVLFSLGMSLLAGACLLRLGKAALLSLGLVIILASQLVIPGPARGGEDFGILARVLLIAGAGRNFLVNYPLFPWLAVTLLGMALGKALLASPQLARRSAWTAACLGLALFCLLRIGCEIGWTANPGEGGVPAFLKMIKYPPSLGFLLITLSINLLLWRLFEAMPPAFAGHTGFLRCFGGVPLFFYVLHLASYTLFALSLPLRLPFWAVYPFWIASLLAFYPVCRLYRDFKRRKPVHSAWRAL
jgi:uncharacterized membrane protein